MTFRQQQRIPSILILLETNFVPLGGNERDVSSLVADEIDNVMDLTSLLQKFGI